MAKKLLKLTRATLYMMKYNIPWFELHMLLKRSTKLAGKAIGNLLVDHQTLTCRPNNIHNTVVAPLAYEFSCNNTPLFYYKRKNNRRSHTNQHDQLTVNNVKRVFDILNDYDCDYGYESDQPVKSPLTLLDFGENVRQLRVTDSPFTENNNEEDGLQVDMAAEEFIRKFYKELKQQKK